MARRRRPEHGLCFNVSTMKRLLFGLCFVAAGAFAAEPHPADSSRPQDGAIQGGSILPGEKSGVPSGAPGNAVERCEELQGRLRDQCLLKEEQRRSSVGGTKKPPLSAPPPSAPPPQNPMAR